MLNTQSKGRDRCPRRSGQTRPVAAEVTRPTCAVAPVRMPSSLARPPTARRPFAWLGYFVVQRESHPPGPAPAPQAVQGPLSPLKPSMTSVVRPPQEDPGKSEWGRPKRAADRSSAPPWPFSHGRTQPLGPTAHLSPLISVHPRTLAVSLSIRRLTRGRISVFFPDQAC